MVDTIRGVIKKDTRSLGYSSNVSRTFRTACLKNMSYITLQYFSRSLMKKMLLIHVETVGMNLVRRVTSFRQVIMKIWDAQGQTAGA